MKRVVLLVLGLLFAFGQKGFALGIDLFVSDTEIYGEVRERVFTYTGNPLFLGIGGFYSEKDEKNFLFNFYLKTHERYKSVFLVGLGLEGFLGEAGGTTKDSTIVSLGFTFFGGVDLKKGGFAVPVSCEVRFLYAPPILSFVDTERVYDGDVSLYFHVNENAAVGARYRMIKVEVDSGEDWEDQILSFGFKISF